MTEPTPASFAGHPFGWQFTAPLLLGSTLNPINTSMLATALVGIGADFHVGPGTTASLVSVLYLLSAISQPTMGKLSIVFGPRRIFLTGVGVMLIGGVVGTAAPSFAFLLVSRALIGVGTAACYPTAMSLVRKRADSLGTGVPSRVLGNFSIAAQVTIVIGLPLGGILTGTFGWRALFAVNIPLALISIALTLLGVAKDDPIARSGGLRLLAAIDLPGIVIFAGTMTSLLFFLSDLTSPTWWQLAVAVLLGGALLAIERRTLSPLIDVRMLARRKPLQRTYLRQVLISIGMYAILYGASQWMEQSRGLSPSIVGLVLIPLSVVSIAVARFVSDHGWVRWPLILAGLALVLAAGVMLLISTQSTIGALVGMTLLIGVTSGLGSFANQAALYIQSPAAEIAVGAGLLRTSTNLAAILSSSIIGITFGEVATDSGFHVLGGVLGAIGIAMVLLTALDSGVPGRTTQGESDSQPG